MQDAHADPVLWIVARGDVLALDQVRRMKVWEIVLALEKLSADR